LATVSSVTCFLSRADPSASVFSFSCMSETYSDEKRRMLCLHTQNH
jgi:hypothetical protein